MDFDSEREAKRPILSPHERRVVRSLRFEPTKPKFPTDSDPAQRGAELECEPAVEPPKPHKLSLHRRLALWGFAGLGALSVAYVIPQQPNIVFVGNALPPPPPNPAAMQASAADAAAVPETLVQVPQEHVTAAVRHVASGCASPSGITLNLPPVQSQLVVHISEGVHSQSDRAIDILVETQAQKPSEAEIRDAKNDFRMISQSALAMLTVESLAEAALSKTRDKGLELAWKALRHVIEELKARIRGPAGDRQSPAASSPEGAHGSTESAQLAPAHVDSRQIATTEGQPVPSPNPILVEMAAAFATLARLFDPSEKGPQTHPIGFIARELHVSEQRASAILQLGPFAEISTGVWALDSHLGDPELLAHAHSLWDDPRTFSWMHPKSGITLNDNK